MLWQRLRSYCFPSPAALTLTWIALFELAIFASFLGVFTLSTESQPQDSLLLFSVTACPLAGVLLFIATLIEKRHGPRLALWAMITTLVAGSAIGVVIPSFVKMPENGVGVLILSATCCLPFLLISFGMTVFSAVRSIPELHAILRATRHRRVLEMIQARGETSLVEIAREVNLSEAQSAALLHQLIGSGELMAFLHAESGRIYNSAAWLEKQRRLSAVVQARGQVHLDDLGKSYTPHPLWCALGCTI